MNMFDYREMPKEDILSNFWKLLDENIKRFADRPLVVSKDSSITFEQTNKQANVISRELPEPDNPKQIGVGLFLNDPLKMVPAILGALKSGGYYVFLDTTYPAATINSMVDDAEIDVILVDQQTASALPKLEKSSCKIIDLDALDYSKTVPNLTPSVGPHDIVRVLFTSGSTGRSKGSINDYKFIARELYYGLAENEVEPGDTSLILSTLTYSATHRFVINALFTGRTLYFHNLNQDGFNPVPDIIQALKITFFGSTPTIFRNFTKTLPGDMQFFSVTRVNLYGEKQVPGDVQAIRKHFPNVKYHNYDFGSTETQVISSIRYPIDFNFEGDLITAGKPYDDIKLLIWDANGDPLKDGEEGEIIVYGDTLVPGYINNPEETKTRFLPDPENPGFQYYKTGDLGKILPNGELLHLGRIDTQVKVKGVRIELSSIEDHARTYPGILEVATNVFEDDNKNKKIILYYVPEAGISIPVSDLRKHLSERLPKHQLPHYFVRMDKIPLTKTGKVAVKELPKPNLVRPELPYPYEPPADELEKKLLTIWEEQLGVKGIGVTDDFFDVGGDSLLGVVLVVAIEESIGKGMPVSILLQAPTIREQAKMIREGETDRAYSVMIPMHTGGSLPPLFFIPGKGGYPTRILHLSKTLDPEIPIYAMQDLLGKEDFHSDTKKIQKTASLYLNEIQKLYPQGPYILVGESMGGKICYEIAQQLREQGQEEPLVFMLDTFNFDLNIFEEFHKKHNIPFYKMLIQKHFNIWIKADWQGKKEYIQFYRGKVFKELKKLLSERKKVLAPAGGQINPTLPDDVVELEREFVDADQDYTVEPYPGRIILIKATRGPYAYDRTNGWDKVDIGKFLIHQIDCYHGSILFEPAVTELADIIQKYVREAYKGKALIKFRNMSKKYARFTNHEVAALDEISFTIKENEFISIVGPSGCGKTTFLKIVAGLIKADSGEVVYEGFENPNAILVFQDQGVLPWMTVLENVGLGLELKGVAKKERNNQAMEFMKVVRLEGFEKYYPHELSGGMRQRVALARAFLTKPDLLLMDEPFGALDAQTRIVMQEELLDIWREYPKTVLFVTHDIDEAVLLSDRVLVMSDRPGKIQAAIDIPIPRPRDLTQKDDPRFLEIRWKIWNLLEKEVREDIKIIQEKHHA